MFFVITETPTKFTAGAKLLTYLNSKCGVVDTCINFLQRALLAVQRIDRFQKVIFLKLCGRSLQWLLLYGDDSLMDYSEMWHVRRDLGCLHP